MAAQKRYQFDETSGLPSGKAQAAGEEYAVLKRQTKDTRKQVEAIKKNAKTYPTLHALVYNRSAGKAAEEYFLSRLRAVVASLIEVNVTIVRKKKRGALGLSVDVSPAPPRAFPHVGGGYRTRDEVTENTALREKYVEAARAELGVWLRKWEGERLDELEPLLAMVRSALVSKVIAKAS